MTEKIYVNNSLVSAPSPKISNLRRFKNSFEIRDLHHFASKLITQMEAKHTTLALSFSHKLKHIFYSFDLKKNKLKLKKNRFSRYFCGKQALTCKQLNKVARKTERKHAILALSFSHSLNLFFLSFDENLKNYRFSVFIARVAFF